MKRVKPATSPSILLLLITVVSLSSSVAADDEFRTRRAENIGQERKDYLSALWQGVSPHLRQIQGCNHIPIVRLFVQLNEKGHVSHTRWKTESGDKRCNSAILKAIKEAAPYPLPPSSFQTPASHQGWQFVIESKDLYPASNKAREDYIAKITKEIKTHYRHKQSCYRAGDVVIETKVDQDGKITGVDFLERSKKEKCNELARDAILKMAVVLLPEAPQLRKEVFDEGFIFSFAQRKKKLTVTEQMGMEQRGEFQGLPTDFGSLTK